MKRAKNIRLCAYLFDSTIISVFTYVSEAWPARTQDEGLLGDIERAVEKSMLGVLRLLQMKGFEILTYVNDRKSSMSFHTPVYR